MTYNLNYQPNYIYDELNEKIDIITNKNSRYNLVPVQMKIFITQLMT